MQTTMLGRSGLTSTRLIYGCMRITKTGDPAQFDAVKRDAARASILAAYDAGFRHFDHADIYGRGLCEQAYGEVRADTPSLRRDDVIVTTKCGIRWAGDPTPDATHRYDFSKEHILWSCEQSLKRLRVDTIDVYLLHRPDLLMNPVEIAAAFDTLLRTGKVRTFGVSNFTPAQVDMLQSHLPMKLVCHQVEVHANRLDPFTDGTLDQCQRLGITPTAWSPLDRGRLAAGGSVKADDPRRERVEATIAALDALAQELSTSRTAAALAWVMKHPAGVLPIVGSTTPEHIRASTAAASLQLTREQWYKVLLASRGSALP